MSEQDKTLNVTRRGLLSATATGAVLATTGVGATLMSAKEASASANSSLEPGELKDMVRSVRQVERAMGDGIKQPQASEIKNMEVARKSLITARPVAKGELFSAQNLTVKRPGNGISPMSYWQLIGTTATRAYGSDEVIE